MRACRDLRDNSAERPMRLVLADDGLRENPAVARNERRCRVVARGFEAEDQRHSPPFARRGPQSPEAALDGEGVQA